MTYQKLNPNYDNADADADADADESSLLVLTAVDVSPSFSLGQDGVATKKNHGVRMIVVVAICFLLGTMAVIHQGSSNSRAVGSSDALLLRQNQAAPVFNPSQGTYYLAPTSELYAPNTSNVCFKDKDNAGKYCWYTQKGSEPYGNWEVDPNPHGNNNCGPMCTVFFCGPDEGNNFHQLPSNDT